MQIITTRLTLIASDLQAARAELSDRLAFSRLIGAKVPENWPPESAADALPWFLERLEADAANFGWLAWYALTKETEEASVLIGGIGFKGRPMRDGTVEVGYSVLPQFHQRGHAAGMLRGILGWAFANPDVMRVVADTMPSNIASVRLLERQGFRPTGPGSEHGSVLFEKLRPKADQATAAMD